MHQSRIKKIKTLDLFLFTLGYGLDGQGLISGSGKICFPYSITSRPALGPSQPPI
jgi:hypothetical protein